MSKAVRIVAMIVAVIVLLFAGFQVANYFDQRIEDNAVHDELSAIADSPFDSDELDGDYILEEIDVQNKLYNYTRRLFGKAAPGKMPISGNQANSSIVNAQKRKINFPALKKKNPQIVAWVSIPNTPVDYAVVQGKDNNYYLTHDALKRRSSGGSIVLDSKLKKDFSSSDSILYGHQMRDKSMFGSLARYRNKNFRDKHQYIYVYTPTATKKYKVSSTFRTTKSDLKPDLSKTKTLTLVTCDGSYAHYVVRAKLVSSKKPGKK